MKQSSKMVMIAVALLAGTGGTAWANGTEVPPPPPPVYVPPPPPPYVPPPPPPPPAKTEEGAYISGAVGIAMPGKFKTDLDGDYDMDDGLALNGALGYNFGSARLEAAAGYQQHNIKDIDEDVSILSLMANAYYDFDTGSDVRPYIMGGLGMANVDMSWTSEDDDVFIWQLGAGLGIKIGDKTTLDLGYRYVKPEDVDTKDATVGKGKCESHNFLVGIRYQF